MFRRTLRWCSAIVKAVDLPPNPDKLPRRTKLIDILPTLINVVAGPCLLFLVYQNVSRVPSPKWDLIVFCGGADIETLLNNLHLNRQMDPAVVHPNVSPDEYRVALESVHDSITWGMGKRETQRLCEVALLYDQTLCMPCSHGGLFVDSCVRLHTHDMGVLSIHTTVASAAALVRRQVPEARITVVCVQPTSLSALEDQLRKKGVCGAPLRRKLEQARQDVEDQAAVSCGWNAPTFTPSRFRRFEMGREDYPEIRAAILSLLRGSGIIPSRTSLIRHVFTTDDPSTLYDSIIKIIPDRTVLKQRPDYLRPIYM